VGKWQVERLQWQMFPEGDFRHGKCVLAFAGPDLWRVRVYRKPWHLALDRMRTEALWVLKHRREYHRIKQTHLALGAPRG
jgi:lipopolysaccharide biosynthesis glycosyltransferase